MMAEKIGAFYKLLNTMEGKEYIETFLLYNVALISAKVKPSITLNLCKLNPKNVFNLWNKHGEEYLKTLNLDYIELRESNKSLIILIYDKNLLEKSIKDKANQEFLLTIGYKNNLEVIEALETLKSRYQEYNCPHELGVFLGYPIEDVKDFMNCASKKCLTCGYWKVYNSEQKAKKVFQLFDSIKTFTAHNIIIGEKSSELAFILANNFKQVQIEV